MGQRPPPVADTWPAMLAGPPLPGSASSPAEPSAPSGARSPALPGSACDLRPSASLRGYLTVYLTVLLVFPFPGPTVAVTSFSAPGKGIGLVMHSAISDDGNGAG